ncbi:5-dehydro-2-deoxygluconokinase [Mycoplasma hyopneumoniae]|uniref:5-dehydro-2-deoxygluconokinase n=1 Tax=Mesomycoplasma hyopneumoniae TaxID=2099 RepID=UPI0013691DD1|nr:5-dehydro-2-deoxygluconokinase [Mesomycoplasma hyopneumoniae]MXR10739.1 5-dehydro-2-deoxygluconokinase [Mesomycoplasma hyopneumoniae]MXR63650.1 5-dehydro-2-deoxygluconokinase [Mesomycoplasma hyopneumoniae]
MKKEFDFILIGRITIDFNPMDYYNNLENSSLFKKYIGGSAANIAIGLSRLKNKVGFFGSVSDDQFGNFVLNVFENEKIDISHIKKTKDHKLGLTFTEMLSEEKSTILMYRDNVADLQIDVSDIDLDYILKTKILVISGTSLAKSPSREAVLKALFLAKNNGIKVVFDIDYRPYSWKNLDEVSLYYQIVAQNSDLIIGSYEEIQLTSRFCLENPENLIDDDYAKYWLKFVDLIIIKNGKKGSKLYQKDKKLVAKIVPVKMLKGYGGGDAYASLFLDHYLKNESDLENGLALATSAASIMVQSHSSFDLPDYQKILEFKDNALKSDPDLVQKKEWNAFKK